MAHQNPDDETLRRILIEAKTVAIVGASSKLDRPSHGIMKKLLAAGYRVIPVNPTEKEVLGRKAYASVLDIPDPVDIVDVFRRSEDTPVIAEEAVKKGARVLWLQLGISNDAAAERAASGGLTVVMDRCIGATHAQLGIPRKG